MSQCHLSESCSKVQSSAYRATTAPHKVALFQEPSHTKVLFPPAGMQGAQCGEWGSSSLLPLHGQCAIT